MIPRRPRCPYLYSILIYTLTAGKILGLMIYSSEGARKWRDKGARFISVPFESVMTSAITNFLEESKS